MARDIHDGQEESGAPEGCRDEVMTELRRRVSTPAPPRQMDPESEPEPEEPSVGEGILKLLGSMDSRLETIGKIAMDAHRKAGEISIERSETISREASTWILEDSPTDEVKTGPGPSANEARKPEVSLNAGTSSASSGATKKKSNPLFQLAMIGGVTWAGAKIIRGFSESRAEDERLAEEAEAMIDELMRPKTIRRKAKKKKAAPKKAKAKAKAEAEAPKVTEKVIERTIIEKPVEHHHHHKSETVHTREVIREGDAQAVPSMDADAVADGVYQRMEKNRSKFKGDRGLKGDKGLKGERGRDGADGWDGRDGIDGRDGRSGRDGRNGRDGKRGPRGPAGPRGASGGVSAGKRNKSAFKGW